MTANVVSLHNHTEYSFLDGAIRIEDLVGIRPPVDVPAGFENAETCLSHIARDGLKKRYAEITPELEKRMEEELDVVNRAGFAGYFPLRFGFGA